MAKLNYDELFPGRFLKSGEFKGRDVTLTVVDVTLEDLPQDKGGTRTRGIVHFAKTKKALVLNRTNGECIKAMFGRDVEEWTGKRVTLYPAPYVDSFTEESTTAIRVRGSPDLPADKVVEVRLPRKKPFKVKLLKTGGQAGRTETRTEQVDEPAVDETPVEQPEAQVEAQPEPKPETARTASTKPPSATKPEPVTPAATQPPATETAPPATTDRPTRRASPVPF